MSGVTPPPATTPGATPSVVEASPIIATDSPFYMQVTAPMMIGNSGTVAASAALGNLTLGTALDAIYGPTNNNCPGIWLYLPSTALASPNNVAGWYWAVMSSTTVGTVYAASPPNAGVSQIAIPSAQLGAANPFSTGGQNAVAFNWAPPTSASIATGSGSGYTGVTTATPSVVFQMAGGTIGPTGSLAWNGLCTVNNSAGTKTFRGVIASAATLATGNSTVASVAMTTVAGGSMTGQILMNGQSSAAGAEASWRFYSAAFSPTLGNLDLSLTNYAGFTLQVGTATDWCIAQLQNMTGSQL